MKIKQDFVTNSSTTSFIISLPKSQSSKCLFKIVKLEKFETYRTLKSLRALIEFTQKEKYDWINDVRGPRRFYYFDEEKYNKWKKYLQDNPKRYIVYTSISRDDVIRVRNIESFLQMIDGEILEKDFG